MARVARSTAETLTFGSVISVTSAVSPATFVTSPMRPSAFTTGSSKRIPDDEPAATVTRWSNSLGGRLMMSVAT